MAKAYTLLRLTCRLAESDIQCGVTINPTEPHRTLPDPATGPYRGIASSPAVDLVQRIHNSVI